MGGISDLASGSFHFAWGVSVGGSARGHCSSGSGPVYTVNFWRSTVKLPRARPLGRRSASAFSGGCGSSAWKGEEENVQHPTSNGPPPCRSCACANSLRDVRCREPRLCETPVVSWASIFIVWMGEIGLTLANRWLANLRAKPEPSFGPKAPLPAKGEPVLGRFGTIPADPWHRACFSHWHAHLRLSSPRRFGKDRFRHPGSSQRR